MAQRETVSRTSDFPARNGSGVPAPCSSPQAPAAYSVLTHEAIIDSTWDSAISPLLLKRFPASNRRRN